MIAVDGTLGVLFLLSVLLWTRGILRQSKSDLIVATAMLLMTSGIYALLYRLAAFPGLPWLAGLLACLGSVTVLILRRSESDKRRARTIQTLCMACLGLALFIGEQHFSASSNSLLVIAPYRSAGTWVFDDPLVGLKAEPFVSGVPELIDLLVEDAGIQEPEKGFRLIFSPQAFPGYQTRVDWRRQEMGGNWYYSESYRMEGWICPALFKYFKRAPKEIYLRAEAR